MNALRHNLLKRFIDEDGISGFARCGCSKDKQPPWSDDSGAEGVVAGINQMNAH
jgi:hypothetical protein